MDDPKTSEEEWWDDFWDFRFDAHHLMDASGREKTIWLPMLFALFLIHSLDGSVELFFGAMLAGLVLSAAFLMQFEWYRMFFMIQSEPDLEELKQLAKDNSVTEIKRRAVNAGEVGAEDNDGPRLTNNGGD